MSNSIPQAKRVIFVGAYGSGKTEVAINYARYCRKNSQEMVSLADLDLVNPYFRSRQKIAEMEELGIKVVAPPGERQFADLPIVLPQIRGMLEKPNGIAIFDLGGDDVGAKVLASLADLLSGKDYQFWLVFNSSRPFTNSLAAGLKIVRAIENSSQLKISGIVSNTHMLEETNLEMIISGMKLASELAQQLTIDLPFISVAEKFVERLIKSNKINCPILAMQLTMLRPWEK